MSDIELVRQARSELPYQHAAFERLVLESYPGVRKLIAGIVGSADDADSLAQDTMLRMMHGLRGLEDESRFEPWLRRIAVNVAKTFLTRRAREHQRQLAYEADQVLTLAEGADSDAASVGLNELMAPLTPDERVIVSFKVLQDLEFSDIAGILGLSLSATKMRYYRALEKLKETTGSGD